MKSFLLSFMMAGLLFASDDNSNADWTMMGQNAANWRQQAAERKIGRSNVNSLAVKWSFTTKSDVSATPAVSGNAVYFPDWNGNLYAVRKNDGGQIWTRQISQYDNFPGALSRVTPAVSGGDLIFGDIESPSQPHQGANIIAVNKENGQLRWVTQVDSHRAAIITGSPVVVGDVVYVGVSSNEEAMAGVAGYVCCTFRGSIVALNAKSGRIIWKTYTVPDNHGNAEGYSGNAIWQPPVIDTGRGLLFVGTGNNYEIPDTVKMCLAQNKATPVPACFAADNYFDSAMAFDLVTGQVKWSRRLQGVDVWTTACTRNTNPTACPLPDSPDNDLSGSGANLFPNMVGFGQKSGMYWALNPDNGEIIWSSMVGPGSTTGGIQWGSATDGTRIYAAITNAKNLPYKLVNGQTVTSGAWSALDVKTGQILWQTADPDNALDPGSLSVANGIVYAPSYSGKMHALDSSDGKVLWSFQSGGSVIDGPSIVDGMVFWGSGYRKIRPGTANNIVYAFGLANGDGNGGENSGKQEQ